jgi:hypothetical protein
MLDVALLSPRANFHFLLLNCTEAVPSFAQPSTKVGAYNSLGADCWCCWRRGLLSGKSGSVILDYGGQSAENFIEAGEINRACILLNMIR